jgi:hypothetical protein
MTVVTDNELIDILKTVVTTDEFGNRCWYLNGQLHRVDGPAAEYADGTNLWYLNGRHLSEEEFNNLTCKK